MWEDETFVEGSLTQVVFNQVVVVREIEWLVLVIACYIISVWCIHHADSLDGTDHEVVKESVVVLAFHRHNELSTFIEYVVLEGDVGIVLKSSTVSSTLNE